MTRQESRERKEALKQAIEWVARQHGGNRKDHIEAAARRFDLSPRDEEFLLRYFAEP